MYNNYFILPKICVFKRQFINCIHFKENKCRDKML